MKKKSKIRVLENDQNDDSHTFIVDTDMFSELNKLQQNSKEVNTGSIDANNLDKVYKKKKVLTNEDIRKTSKGLKCNNPSQRNHSSVYE